MIDSAIPKYDQCYQPFLTALADGQVHRVREIRDILARQLSVTQEEQAQLLPNGSQPTFSSRVGWAGTYLLKAGLVRRPARGCYQLTEEGRRALNTPGLEIDNRYLMRFPSFVEFFQAHNGDQYGTPQPAAPAGQPGQAPEPLQARETPQDTIEAAMGQINAALAQELMEEIMAQSPEFFEHLVVQLLLKMGYGGPFEDAGIVTGRTGDGGIDGVIKEDKLGFSQIYLQAKRWAPDTVVSRPEIHKFCGALQDRGGSKGLFITTCKFSPNAIETAQRQHIVLVDGDTLTRLMIEYNIGVSPVQTYTIKQLNSDFFSQDQ